MHEGGLLRLIPGESSAPPVDPQLRVHGLQNLRVADCSIMPAVTSGNTHAPAVMIGERAVDFILSSAKVRETNELLGV
ncbi:GMC oxidoreductase [Pseudarthrobacter oxydans]|uniref:GMC oxidoreductase n=1 Tax=Pseudarthrobacter oxydans TaxID=1671 RepID=UPI00381F7B6E